MSRRGQAGRAACAARRPATRAPRAPTSARGSGCRRRRPSRGGRDRARRGCRGRVSFMPALGADGDLRARGRSTRSSPGSEPARATTRTRSRRAGCCGGRCSRVGMMHEPLGAQRPGRRRRAGASGRRRRARRRAAAGPAVSTQNAAMTSANQSSVYGWRGRSSESPCSGRSGRTSRKRWVRCSTTGSNSRCESPALWSSTSAGPDARLAVGDARAVGRVEQAKPHPRVLRRALARRPPASAARTPGRDPRAAALEAPRELGARGRPCAATPAARRADEEAELPRRGRVLRAPAPRGPRPAA